MYYRHQMPDILYEHVEKHVQQLPAVPVDQQSIAERQERDKKLSASKARETTLCLKGMIKEPCRWDSILGAPSEVSKGGHSSSDLSAGY